MKSASKHPPTPVTARRPVLARGQIWCATCLAPAPEEGSESTKHGFKFCKKHRAKTK